MSRLTFTTSLIGALAALACLMGVWFFLTSKHTDSSVLTNVNTVKSSATVDQDGQILSSPNPIISGTASGTGPFLVNISSTFNGGGGASNIVSTSHNRWSITLDPKTFPSDAGLYTSKGVVPNGEYKVSLYQGSITVPGQELVSARIVVKNTSAGSPSAAIDQSSLIQKVLGDKSPIITGTASNTDRVYVTVNGNFYEESVINGHWSTSSAFKHSFSSGGTYLVEVRDSADGSLLTTGTLLTQ